MHGAKRLSINGSYCYLSVLFGGKSTRYPGALGQCQGVGSPGCGVSRRSLRPSHTASDHVAPGIMGKERRAAPLLPPRPPELCREPHAALGTSSHPNASPGKGTHPRFSPILSFDVGFLGEAYPAPFPPQGERRVVWPSLGKFLRRPGPAATRALSRRCSHMAPFPPAVSIEAASGEPSPRNYSVPNACLETPSSDWDPLWVPPAPARDRRRKRTAVRRQVRTGATRPGWRQHSIPRGQDTYEIGPCRGLETPEAAAPTA